MISRGRTLAGALLLCALSICAFGAASASAEGLTAVECVELPSGKYNTSQCLTPAVPGNFETVVIAGKQEVEGTATVPVAGGGHKVGTTAEPAVVFHSTFAGIEVTVTCATAHASGGTIENKTEGTLMRIHLTGSSATYTDCHASPRTKPTKICTVQGVAPATPVGQIKTNPTTGTTGLEHKLTLKPVEGETFTKFKLNASGGECFLGAAVEVTVTGEGEGEINTTTHSHVTSNELTGGEKLKANGAKATLTATGTGFTKRAKETDPQVLVGAETF